MVLESKRQVWAVFGELFLSIISEENRLPGLERLEVSASIQHDDYSDFGGSTNPKIGVLWSLFSGLSIVNVRLWPSYLAFRFEQFCIFKFRRCR